MSTTPSVIPGKRKRGPNKSTNNPEIDAIPQILAILKPLSEMEQDKVLACVESFRKPATSKIGRSHEPDF